MNKVKREVQHYLYSTSGLKSNVLTLCGPNPHGVYDDYKTVATSKSKLYLYDVHKEYLDRINAPDVVKYHSNIENAKPQRFMDIDLMRVIESEKELITSLFKKQLLANYQRKTCFIFTVCMRGSNSKNIDQFLHTLLKGSIMWTIDPFSKWNRFVMNFNNYTIEKIHYRSQYSPPMCSVRILWSNT